MPEPTNSRILEVATKYLRAAQGAYGAHPELSCNQKLIVSPSQFIVETAEKRLCLIVSAPNDPRALPLITEALRPIRRLDDLLVIVPPKSGEEPHTIPGILCATSNELNLGMEYPFVSIADPKLLDAVEVRLREKSLGFTRHQLLGSIVTNAAISDQTNLRIDSLSGIKRLLPAWASRFPLIDILQGTFELQNPNCPELVYQGCVECVSECIEQAKRTGAATNPENPDFIEKIVRLAESKNLNLSSRHILGYAVCSFSIHSSRTIPNYVHTILKAYGTWKTAVSLEEIYASVTDWLVSHQPNFDAVMSDNAKIAKAVTETENEASANGLKRLFANSREHIFVGWCRNGDIRPFQRVFSVG